MAVRSVLVCVLTLAVGTTLVGQEAKQGGAKRAPAKRKATVPPAYAPIKEDPALPRVLLIGDSISIGYTLAVRELLQGEANVLRPATNCGPTSRGVESLDSWLGEGKWDVIHFNFGLHDLVYYSADGKERAEPKVAGARHQVPSEQYERNLRTMVARLQKTNAKLIWCSTTPIPEGSNGRVADESVEYNAIALKVMQEHGIAVDDLHAFALPKLADIQLPKNVHFTDSGSRVLAGQVAASIRSALPKKAAAR